MRNRVANSLHLELGGRVAEPHRPRDASLPREQADGPRRRADDGGVRQGTAPPTRRRLAHVPLPVPAVQLDARQGARPGRGALARRDARPREGDHGRRRDGNHEAVDRGTDPAH
eukprot:4140151-Prymnesium_polylepis.2